MKYKTLVIDPPYMLCTGGSKHLNPKNHYPLQNQKDIINTVKNWLHEYEVADESHLYLWTINSFSSGRSNGITDALEICKEIGFKPITLLTWIKNNSNPTPYGQRMTEMCVFASKWRKGNHKRVMYKGDTSEHSVVNNLSSSIDVFYGDRREHSRKPKSFYEYVESRSKPPYLEFYSRAKREQWTCLGNQVGKYK